MIIHIMPFKPRGAKTTAPARPPAQPMQAPADVVQARLTICHGCENQSGGSCRLFACCTKNLLKTVSMALEKCPVGHWQMWTPNKIS
jgi:hypothetical protein